jgi:hypothetical protein
VIATAMANRANRIAFAMVRDQRPLPPTGRGEPGFPIPVGRARLVGWEAGSDTAGDLADPWYASPTSKWLPGTGLTHRPSW